MRVFASILAALLVALGAAPAAWAADKPVASEPRPHQVLSDPPGWVNLAFARQLNAADAKLLVLNSAGEPVTVNALIVEGTNMTMQLKDGLAKDTYTVHYRLNGANGDVQGGAFQFAYGKAHWTAVQDESWTGTDQQPAIFTDTDPQGNPTSSASPSQVPDVVVVPSSGPTITVNASPTASATSGPATEPTSAPTGGFPWVLTIVVAVLIVGAGALVVLRRKGKV